MKTTYWLLVIDGVEPNEVLGPFFQESLRDNYARRVRTEDEDDILVFPLNIVNGNPFIGSYSGAFFAEAPV